MSTTFSLQIISSRLLRVVIGEQKINFIGKVKLEQQFTTQPFDTIHESHCTIQLTFNLLFIYFLFFYIFNKKFSISTK